jgi:hypothetical protein
LYSTGRTNIIGEDEFTPVYDPTLDLRQHDVGVSREGKEVAVAILRNGEAFAFSTKSYDYVEFGNPDWRLAHGTYKVTVRVRGASVGRKRDFKLEYLSDNFADFRLQEI